MRIKSFDRYVLREIASPFSIGLIVYTFTLLIHNMLMLSNTLISRGASGLTILQMMLYFLPDLLAFTIPMSTLMGVLAGLSRMSTDSEVVALRTMGVSNFRILRPVIAFSIIAWLLSSWLIMYLAPDTNFKLSQLLNKLYLSKTVSSIKPRQFYTQFPYYILYFNDRDQQTEEWNQVFLYSLKDGNRDMVILAEKGKFYQSDQVDERAIILQNAQVHSFEKKEPQSHYAVTSYGQLRENIPNLHVIKQTRNSHQLRFPQLVKRMKEKSGNLLLAIEFHQKFSLPFACLALGFLALSLGISTKKGGKTSGFTISLGIILVYYVLITASRNFILKGLVPPLLGMWLANIFLLVSGGILYYYTSREKSISWDRLTSFFSRGRKKARVLLVVKIRKPAFHLVNILDAYIFKRLILSFLMIFTSLIMVFFVVNVIELIGEVIENNVAFFLIFKYVYYNTPEIIGYVLPVATLTSVLITFSLMSKNNEITAVQVSGISLHRLVLPALILGLVLSISFFFMQEKITPRSNKRAQEILNVIRNRNVRTEAEYNKHWVISEDNRIFFYNYFDPKEEEFLRFNAIHLNNDDFTISKRLYADSARWVDAQHLLLRGGYERTLEVERPSSFAEFSSMLITVPQGRDLFREKVIFSQYMNIKELKTYIKYLEKNQAETRRYRSELHTKYAFPFSSLVMVLVAFPFSFLMGRRGALYGIGIAVGLSIIYWGTIAVFNSLGFIGILSPFLSAFAPLFIFLTLSLSLLLNIKT